MTRLRVTAVVGVAVLALVTGLGTREMKVSQAHPKQPIAIAPDICSALLAVGAPEADTENVFFSCQDMTAKGGFGGVNLTYGVAGLVVPNIVAVAASATQADGEDDVFPPAKFPGADEVPACNVDAPVEDGEPVIDDIQELLCALDVRDGALDSRWRLVPEDFAGLDLEADQMHDRDGQLAILAFVDDDSPVLFETDRARFVGGDVDFLCNTEAQDEDCDSDGVRGDGVVVGQLEAGAAGAERGQGEVWVTQGGITWPFPFTVVGEPDSLAFVTLEAAIQTGLTQEDCPLPTDAPGFLAAGGEPQKAIVLVRAFDDDGNQVTGAFFSWETDDPDKAVMAAPLTPTIDLGAFGLGAPNIICGTEDPGTVAVIGRILSQAGQLEILPIAFELFSEDEDGNVEFTVIGEAASVQLTAAPASIPCDGVTSSTVTATVTDSDGNKVVNGTEVRFNVRALGTANPIVAKTADGVATSIVTPLAAGQAGVPVIVTAGDAEASILVSCTAGPPAAPLAPPVAPPPAGIITAPPTGTGGYLSQDGSGGLPWWPVLPVSLGVAVAVLWRAALACGRR